MPKMLALRSLCSRDIRNLLSAFRGCLRFAVRYSIPQKHDCAESGRSVRVSHQEDFITTSAYFGTLRHRIRLAVALRSDCQKIPPSKALRHFCLRHVVITGTSEWRTAHVLAYWMIWCFLNTDSASCICPTIFSKRSLPIKNAS